MQMSIVSPSLIRHAVRGMRAAPVSPHAFAGRVPEETVDWAGSFGLLPSDREKEQALRIRVGDLAALTFTRHSVDVVRLGADLILWLYLFDDAIGEAPPAVQFDQHREQLAKFERLLRFGGHGEAEPFLRSLADIRRRATQLNAGDDWHRRFADDMADYFAGCADEAIYRRARMTPNIQVYRALRAQTVGTSAVFAIAELGDEDQPRPGEMVRAEVVEALRVAAQLTAWVNDIYSYPKEAAQGDPMNRGGDLSRTGPRPGRRRDARCRCVQRRP